MLEIIKPLFAVAYDEPLLVLLNRLVGVLAYIFAGVIGSIVRLKIFRVPRPVLLAAQFASAGPHSRATKRKTL